MTSRIDNFVNTATARISTPGSTGTGVFIYHNTLLTCAHVVIDKEASSSEDVRTYDEIEVHYDGMILNGIVEAYSDIHYPDLALVTVTPSPAHPCLRISDQPKPLVGTNYMAKGYQLREKRKDQDNKVQIIHKKDTLSLVYEGLSGEGEELLYRFEDARVRGGISGAPIVNYENGELIGVLKRSIDLHGDAGGWGIPADRIFSFLKERCPEIDHKIRDRNFQHRLDSWKGIHMPPYEHLVKDGLLIGMLFFFSFAFMLWFLRHDDLTWYALFAPAASVALAGTRIAIENKSIQHKKNIGALVNQVSSLLLNRIFLTLFGALTLFLWGFRSSIQLDVAPGPERINLAYIDSSDAVPERTLSLTPGSSNHLKLSTLPWGKEYLLAPKDYVPRKVKLYPWGTSFSYPYDFELEPLMYIRFDCFMAKNPLMDGGRLVITAIRNGEEKVVLERTTRRGQGAFRIGRRDYEFSRNHQKEWLTQLNRKYAFTVGIPEAMDSCSAIWGRYVQVDVPNIDLSPRSTGQVLFYKSDSPDSPISDNYDFVNDSKQEIFITK